jgi:D-threonine aldolase
MSFDYSIENAAAVPSPALLVYPELIAANVRAAIAMAGEPARLRPHAKTHKCAKIVQLLLAEGIQKHKCATLAEAEMLAHAGAEDVLLAYPLVGPNVRLYRQLQQAYPRVHFSSLIDHPVHVEALKESAARVMIDVNVGQHRTGVALERVAALAELVCNAPNLTLAGLQAYDGHNSMQRVQDREAAVAVWLAPLLSLRETLERAHGPQALVVGGTPTFPVLASRTAIQRLECSPGTFVLHDRGYSSKFADLAAFQPAAALLARVISRPSPTRVTLDLGTKALASDPPLAQRVHLLNAPPHEIASHNEEHLCIEMQSSCDWPPGHAVYAQPGHICPTVALHEHLWVVRDGVATERWPVSARHRTLRLLQASNG